MNSIPVANSAEDMRRWLTAMVTASSDAIVSFSMDATILSWNPAAERIYGYTAQEAVGSTLSILAPGDDVEQARVLAIVSAAQGLQDYETICRRKDGGQLRVSLTISPVVDDAGNVLAGMAIVRDITVPRQIEEALRESEERFRLIVDNATEFAIFSLDLQRRVTTWNSGAQRLLGYASDEIVGQSADGIFTPEDRAARQPEREARTALAEGRASDDRWHVRKDGSRFWASGAAMPMRNARGEAVGFVKILRDQTAARESRDALERTQTELQAADEAKDRFLAVLSHELRNPLASIHSSAELMLDPSARQADAREAAQVVQRQALSMKALLDDLLDVSRLKFGRLELHVERVRLSALVAGALEVTRPLLAGAGHQLTVDLPREDIELEGDLLRLGQVVTNLLANAIRYTPRGGRITIAARLDDGQLAISVKDTGRGMKPERIDSMFDMFTQGEEGAERASGLGIGLALVKSIVALHGGRVSAHSAGPGQGSEFRVVLPGARAVTALPAATAPAVPAPAGKRRTVLVADDNTDAAWGIAKLLEMAGYDTLRARDGAEAVHALEQHRPDAAVIDIGMPGFDGHEVARRVRAAPWGKDMVLIAATGWGQEADERAARDAGFDAHMTKPVELRRLGAMLDALLPGKRS